MSEYFSIPIMMDRFGATTLSELVEKLIYHGLAGDPMSDNWTSLMMYIDELENSRGTLIQGL